MMVVVAVALLNDRGQILLSQRKVNQSFPGAYNTSVAALISGSALEARIQWVVCGALLTLTYCFGRCRQVGVSWWKGAALQFSS